MRTWVLLLALAALSLAGCSGPAPPVNPTGPQDLSMDKNGDPGFAPSSGGIAVVWNFTGTWNHDEPSGPINVTLIVKLYDKTNIGNDAVNVSFAPRGNETWLMRSSFVGVGDYYYHLTARDASGKTVGTRAGLWETCFC